MRCCSGLGCALLHDQVLLLLSLLVDLEHEGLHRFLWCLNLHGHIHSLLPTKYHRVPGAFRDAHDLLHGLHYGAHFQVPDRSGRKPHSGDTAADHVVQFKALNTSTVYASISDKSMF